MDKKCVGSLSGNRCGRLEVQACIGKSCPFYQTVKQAIASKKIAFTRLAGLDHDVQKYISEKYFANRMPWLKGGVSK